MPSKLFTNHNALGQLTNNIGLDGILSLYDISIYFYIYISIYI